MPAMTLPRLRFHYATTLLLRRYFAVIIFAFSFFAIIAFLPMLLPRHIVCCRYFERYNIRALRCLLHSYLLILIYIAYAFRYC